MAGAVEENEETFRLQSVHYQSLEAAGGLMARLAMVLDTRDGPLFEHLFINNKLKKKFFKSVYRMGQVLRTRKVTGTKRNDIANSFRGILRYIFKSHETVYWIVRNTTNPPKPDDPKLVPMAPIAMSSNYRYYTAEQLQNILDHLNVRLIREIKFFRAFSLRELYGKPR